MSARCIANHGLPLPLQSQAAALLVSSTNPGMMFGGGAGSVPPPTSGLYAPVTGEPMWGLLGDQYRAPPPAPPATGQDNATSTDQNLVSCLQCAQSHLSVSTQLTVVYVGVRK